MLLNSITPVSLMLLFCVIEELALHQIFSVLLLVVLYDQRELFCFSPLLLCPWCFCSVLGQNLTLHLFCCPSCCCSCVGLLVVLLWLERTMLLGSIFHVSLMLVFCVKEDSCVIPLLYFTSFCSFAVYLVVFKWWERTMFLCTITILFLMLLFCVKKDSCFLSLLSGPCCFCSCAVHLLFLIKVNNVACHHHFCVLHGVFFC